MSMNFNQYDFEAIKKLDAFLPDKIFDSHMHISEFPFAGKERFGFREYYEDMSVLFPGRKIRCNALATPTEELKSDAGHLSTIEFFKKELDEYPENVGEILVKPAESADEIESHLVHENIRGLKCYCTYADRRDTLNADINEYLPESALEVADKRGLAITLHMVKENGLADPENMRQIKEMTRRYPNATLILAHAARSFAAWNAVEAAAELRDFENVWYDFSAICESAPMMQILRKIGVSRCMWGSDYNVCMREGRAISIGDGFYWIDSEDIKSFSLKTTVHPWQLCTENLMALRQASLILDLSVGEVEDIFYNNAARLFRS